MKRWRPVRCDLRGVERGRRQADVLDRYRNTGGGVPEGAQCGLGRFFRLVGQQVQGARKLLDEVAI
jgi:hypothetical protein